MDIKATFPKDLYPVLLNHPASSYYTQQPPSTYNPLEHPNHPYHPYHPYRPFHLPSQQFQSFRSLLGEIPSTNAPPHLTHQHSSTPSIISTNSYESEESRCGMEEHPNSISPINATIPNDSDADDQPSSHPIPPHIHGNFLSNHPPHFNASPSFETFLQLQPQAVNWQQHWQQQQQLMQYHQLMYNINNNNNYNEDINLNKNNNDNNENELYPFKNDHTNNTNFNFKHNNPNNFGQQLQPLQQQLNTQCISSANSMIISEVEESGTKVEGSNVEESGTKVEDASLDWSERRKSRLMKKQCKSWFYNLQFS